MKKLLLATGAAMALGIASTGYAAALAAPGSVGTLPGFYLGVGAGVGGINTPKLNDRDKALGLGNYSEDIRGFVARGFLGYFWAIPQVQNLQLGAELGYNHYPDNKYSIGTGTTKTSWKYDGWNVDLLAVGKYNFSDSGFNVIGKVGPAYVKQKTTVSGATVFGNPVLTPSSTSNSKVRAEAAIGLGYDINQNFDVNLVYAYIFGNKPANVSSNPTRNDFTKVAPVYTLLLNATYHIGNVGGLA